jgi:hypothetical protein
MLGEEPMVALEVLNAVLPFAIGGLVEVFHDRNCSGAVSLRCGWLDGGRLLV